MDKLENIRSAVVSSALDNAKAAKPGNVASASKQILEKKTIDPPVQNALTTNSKPVGNTKTLAENVKVNEEKVREAVKEINNELVKLQSELGFSVDKVANNVVVTVKRKESGEIVRQIPSESILKLAHNFERLKGVLMDELY